MTKEFNTAGNCIAREHYMMDHSRQFGATMGLVERGKYFVINRPRQFGKTTMLLALLSALRRRADYLPVALNFQGIDSSYLRSDAAFAQMFAQELGAFLQRTAHPLSAWVEEQRPSVQNLNHLSAFISRFVSHSGRKCVLLIDEVDASSDFDAFLSFLGMLRSKYLLRDEGEASFHSVVLVGVHDIKSLKYKLREASSAQVNSPWNIAVDFDVEMEFRPSEIEPMLREYAAAEGVAMDFGPIAERLFYHTSGYPFLVSKLCKILAESILPAHAGKNTWELADVDAAVQALLRDEQSTNFDSLFKNLENHDDLHDLVARVVIEGEEISFNAYNPSIRKGLLYGIFSNKTRLSIHNRVYEQLIYQYLASKIETRRRWEGRNGSSQFKLAGGGLDFRLVLGRFQQFMREEYSEKAVKFLEREWRLLFLAFIRPIVNGEGYTFKEVQVSEERRLDVVVTFGGHRYIVELKRWYGGEYHGRGLDQLAAYLDAHGLSEGYLLIFDERKARTWAKEDIAHRGKKIFAVWV